MKRHGFGFCSVARDVESRIGKGIGERVNAFRAETVRRKKRIDESFAGNGGERCVVGTADGRACGHVAVSVVPSTTLWKRVLWK